MLTTRQIYECICTCTSCVLLVHVALMSCASALVVVRVCVYLFTVIVCGYIMWINIPGGYIEIGRKCVVF